jgi:ferric-dicitrate binding protein FerR (iron transport regulator)
MTSSEKHTPGDEVLGKLIASAGPGSTASPEAKQRIYDAVHARWQSEAGRNEVVTDDNGVRSTRNSDRRRHGSSPGRRREFHTTRRFRALGIAATIAISAITVYWLQGPQAQRTAHQEAAQFATVEGGVEWLRADGSSQPVAAETVAAIQIGDTLRTGADGRVALRLDDGLSLRVNRSSELVFSSADEIELLGGTIYVDTAGSGQDNSSGRNNSLRIDTRLGEIEHLGTQYEVQLSDSVLRVRVREGSIAYTGAGATEIGQAGEQLDIDPEGFASRSTVTPNDPDWEWVSALATLPEADEYRVREVLAWIARELGLELDFSSFGVEQRLTNQTLIGLEGLNPTEALDVIQRMTNVATDISGERLSIGN